MLQMYECGISMCEKEVDKEKKMISEIRKKMKLLRIKIAMKEAVKDDN